MPWQETTLMDQRAGAYERSARHNADLPESTSVGGLDGDAVSRSSPPSTRAAGATGT